MESVVLTVLDYLTAHFIETSACGVVVLCLLAFLWWWHQYRMLHGKDPKMTAEELLAWDTRTEEERNQERAARRRQARVEMEYFSRDRGGRGPSPSESAPFWTLPPAPPPEDLVKSADTREDLRSGNPIAPRQAANDDGPSDEPPTRKRKIRPKRQ